MARARSGSSSSRAPAAIRFSSVRLLSTRGLMRRARSARSLNGLSPRASTSASIGLPPDALDGGERIADRARAFRVVGDVEHDAGAVDRGRLDPDAEALRLAAEFGELVGVVEVERHRRGQELDRVVGLEIGGLEGDEGVGRRVALVEAVIGELGEEVEDLVRLGLVEPALDRALTRSARAGRPSRP